MISEPQWNFVQVRNSFLLSHALPTLYSLSLGLCIEQQRGIFLLAIAFLSWFTNQIWICKNHVMHENWWKCHGINNTDTLKWRNKRRDAYKCYLIFLLHLKGIYVDYFTIEISIFNERKTWRFTLIKFKFKGSNVRFHTLHSGNTVGLTACFCGRSCYLMDCKTKWLKLISYKRAKRKISRADSKEKKGERECIRCGISILQFLRLQLFQHNFRFDIFRINNNSLIDRRSCAENCN